MAKKKIISKRVGQGSEQFQLRLPDGMRDDVAAVAARNGRSMNAEILHALAMHLAAEGVAVDQVLKSRLRITLGSALLDLLNDLVDEQGKQLRKDERTE